eukprot:gene17153-35498_t
MGVPVSHTKPLAYRLACAARLWCKHGAAAPACQAAKAATCRSRSPTLVPTVSALLHRTGLWADLVRQRFATTCRRLGLNRERVELDLGQFRPGLLRGQSSLF